MGDAIGQIMEQASLALGRMDYLTCEARCLEALGLARQRQRWSDYARILLPLQEARRQRRQIAADGRVRLGTSNLPGDPGAWLDGLGDGCMVVTAPHGREHAEALRRAADERGRYVEVLYAPRAPQSGRWSIATFSGPPVEIERAAPPASWVNRWLDAEESAIAVNGVTTRPVDWFLDSTELLGDAALVQVDAPPGTVVRIRQLEARLAAQSDHEILHQRLADAARAMRQPIHD
jgi:hypothetical protein